MLKFTIAIIAAAAIAGVLTLLPAASGRIDASPLAKPDARISERRASAIETGPGPMGAGLLLLTTDRLTPSAGMLGPVADARSILLKTSQIQDW